jgi:mannobiose 2-epimerase
MTSPRTRCAPLLEEIRHHLREELLPFWATHGVDQESGGYLTYFDAQGAATGEKVKTLVCQTRMLYAYASAYRAGYGGEAFLERARQGADFLINCMWDGEYEGWYWTVGGCGKPLNQSKLTYGHSFAIYALSEYGMASGDHRGLEWAAETYQLLEAMASDNAYGGFYEFLERDWTKKPPGRKGGDRKSFDIHMHLMEAFTNLYEATGAAVYRDRTLEMVRLIQKRILHPEYGTGQAQFLLDWTPVRQILFEDVWGSDRDADQDVGRPLDNTSYGHNVEFAWLLLHTLRILGEDAAPYKASVKRLLDHCVDYGIDWERGGVYCEGPHAGPARERNKEFWQQAETLVAMLDGYLLFGDDRYLDAYEKVHRFVMDHVINHDVGEWFPLFDEDNNLLWDYMGHAWKINYHTVRSMIQTERRLERIARESAGG